MEVEMGRTIGFVVLRTLGYAAAGITLQVLMTGLLPLQWNNEEAGWAMAYAALVAAVGEIIYNFER